MTSNYSQTTDLTDLMTLKELSQKYRISYNTLYTQIVEKKKIPYRTFAGIRVKESDFINYLNSADILKGVKNERQSA